MCEFPKGFARWVAAGLLLIAALSLSWNPVSGAEFGVCEYALVQCLGDASIMDWLTRAVIGQVYYCLNGYAFCETYLIPLLD